MNNLVNEQPAPVGNDQPASWESVIRLVDTCIVSAEGVERLSTLMREPSANVMETVALLPGLRLVRADMADRDAMGRARYGVPLQPHNGRDSLLDAYQETLDQIVYLANDLVERGISVESAEAKLDLIGQCFFNALDMAVAIRGEIARRGTAA